MMRAVRESSGKRGTRCKSNATEDNLLVDIRDQIAADQPEARSSERDYSTGRLLGTLRGSRPSGSWALVVGNSVDPRDQQIQTLLTNFLISAPALGPAVGQVATCRGVAPAL